jgi:D-3-phosphoglycerate dehydrogenase / 2-oxoglutarate reductase
MHRIWIDENLVPSALPLLDGVAEIVGPKAPLSELATCDASLVPGSRKWDAAFMAHAPKLKVLSRLGVGYDNISVPDATAHNMVVCYAPEAPMVSTAEHALTLMFAVAKKIRPLDIAARKGHGYAHIDHLKGMELDGRTLGLVGVGRIGSRVAIACRAIGMRVLGFDPYLSLARANELGIELTSSLESLLNQSDVVSLHVPVLPETRNFINAARGALVDEAALTDALARGHLSGAGLDVFQKEPPEVGHPFGQFENVVMTPHVASHTDAGHHRLYETAIAQALQVLRGEKPQWLLNPEVWDKRRR